MTNPDDNSNGLLTAALAAIVGTVIACAGLAECMKAANQPASGPVYIQVSR